MASANQRERNVVGLHAPVSQRTAAKGTSVFSGQRNASTRQARALPDLLYLAAGSICLKS